MKSQKRTQTFWPTLGDALQSNKDEFLDAAERGAYSCLTLVLFFYLARVQSLDPGLTHLLHKQKTVYLVLDDIDV